MKLGVMYLWHIPPLGNMRWIFWIIWEQQDPVEFRKVGYHLCYTHGRHKRTLYLHVQSIKQHIFIGFRLWIKYLIDFFSCYYHLCTCKHNHSFRRFFLTQWMWMKEFYKHFSKTLSNTQPNIKRDFLWDFFLVLWRFNRNVWNITHVNRSPYNTTLMYLLLWTWQPIDRAIIYSLTIRLQIYRETTRIKHLLLYCIK